MAKKSKPTKKKKSFVLSDEELDKVSGGTGVTAPVVRKVGGIAVNKGISVGGTVMEPYGERSGGPAPVNRSTGSGFGGGEQM